MSRLNVSPAVMRQIIGKAPKHVVGDRVAGCFSGSEGVVTKVKGIDVTVKMDDGRSITQSPHAWVKRS